MKIRRGETFGPSDIVELDGCRFEGCTFDKCQIVYRGKEGWGFDDRCQFIGPRWDFVDHAGATIDLLQMLWQFGGRTIVENLLSQPRRPVTITKN